MSDDVEKLVAGLSPREPPRELRRQVLDAMQAELHRSHIRRRDRRIAAAVGIAICVAVLANYVVAARQDAALARLFGPPRESSQIGEIVDMIRSVTDARTVALVRTRLEKTVVRPDPARTLAALEHYHETLYRMATATLETRHEQKENRSEMDRRGTRNPDRGVPTTQRAVGLDVRLTA